MCRKQNDVRENGLGGRAARRDGCCRALLTVVFILCIGYWWIGTLAAWGCSLDGSISRRLPQRPQPLSSTPRPLAAPATARTSAGGVAASQTCGRGVSSERGEEPMVWRRGEAHNRHGEATRQSNRHFSCGTTGQVTWPTGRRMRPGSGGGRTAPSATEPGMVPRSRAAAVQTAVPRGRRQAAAAGPRAGCPTAGPTPLLCLPPLPLAQPVRQGSCQRH